MIVPQCEIVAPLNESFDLFLLFLAPRLNVVLGHDVKKSKFAVRPIKIHIELELVQKHFVQ